MTALLTFLAYIFLIIFAFVAGVIGGLWLARKDIARARHGRRLADECAAHYYAKCEAMERAEDSWPEVIG